MFSCKSIFNKMLPIAAIGLCSWKLPKKDVSKTSFLAQSILQCTTQSLCDFEIKPSSTQNKPAASIWSRIQQGETLSARDKKTAFIQDCSNLAHENQKIQKHPHDGSKLRLATYNVHAWADPYFNRNSWPKTISSKLAKICLEQGVDVESRKVTPIFDVIDALDADILVLQEVAADSLAEFEDYKKIFHAMGYHYGLETFGNMNNDVHSQYGPFGNWILSKYPLSGTPKVTHFSHQYTGHLENKEDSVDRCFVNAKITLPSGEICSIYGTHLDVFDDSEKVRFHQIQELMNEMDADLSDNLILAGDLNSVRPDDYTPANWDLLVQDNAKRKNEFSQAPLSDKASTIVLEYLKGKGLVDSFSLKGIAGPQFTTWSGTTIDFIMMKNNSNRASIDDSAVYFSGASDHIPVLMDLNTKERISK